MRHLRVYRCPVHKTIYSLTVETIGGNGVRIGGVKCCVDQYVNMIATFPMTPERIAELIEELAHE